VPVLAWWPTRAWPRPRHAAAPCRAGHVRGQTIAQFVPIYRRPDRQSAERLALVGTLRKRSKVVNSCCTTSQIECGSRRMVGVEALVRAASGAGLVGPDRSSAGRGDRSDRPADALVIDAALHQARVWLDAGLEVPIAVNLSSFDVQDPRIPAVIAGLLARWTCRQTAVRRNHRRRRAGRLGAGRGRPAATPATRRGCGARHFGSGYSSLGYLKQFPVHDSRSIACWCPTSCASHATEPLSARRSIWGTASAWSSSPRRGRRATSAAQHAWLRPGQGSSWLARCRQPVWSSGRALGI